MTDLHEEYQDFFEAMTPEQQAAFREEFAAYVKRDEDELMAAMTPDERKVYLEEMDAILSDAFDRHG